MFTVFTFAAQGIYTMSKWRKREREWCYYNRGCYPRVISVLRVYCS